MHRPRDAPETRAGHSRCGVDDVSYMLAWACSYRDRVDRSRLIARMRQLKCCTSPDGGVTVLLSCFGVEVVDIPTSCFLLRPPFMILCNKGLYIASKDTSVLVRRHVPCEVIFHLKTVVILRE